MCACRAVADDGPDLWINDNDVQKSRTSRARCCLARFHNTACADLRGASGHPHGTPRRGVTTMTIALPGRLGR